MPEQLWFTEILNHHFGVACTAFLRILHIEPRYPQAPFTNAFAMELLVFVFLIVIFLVLRSKLSVERPDGLQHLFELLESGIQSQSNEIIGHHSEGFAPFLAALALFILFCNLIGLIPSLEAPTAKPEVPLGCAVLAFVYYHIAGIFRNGVLRYAKQFLGPSDPSISLFVRIPVALLMLVIEPISHLARVLSLTIRLWANMFAGDLVIMAFFAMVPIGLPIIFLGLHVFVAVLQTYIFVLLTTVYLQGAVAESH
jgi:F-type H+-transporting ATPase subunit a